MQAKANFNRICQLLIDKGSDALRRALHVKHPASTLAAALHSHRKTLQKLRYTVINPPQWRLLYPPTGSPNSNDFDITLLTILLRNICSLPSPASGWNAMPPATDTSMSADILRIKIFRNEVYGHTASAQYDDATFEKLWQEISQPLVKLGIPQQEIDELKVTPLSPEEKGYNEKLKKWKELEDTLLEKMKDFENQMDDMRAEVKKLKGTLGSSNISNLDQLTKFNFKGKIDDLCEKFQEGTRQWFIDQLSTWFADEESRVMILTAGPGMGKSVLSAKVCQDYSERGKLAGCHFCDFRKSNYSKPSNIIESLASQMCDNVDGFREKLREILGRNPSRDSLSDAFTVLLNEPLHALDRREPMLIVVDALDESKTDDKSEFLELISDEFPDLPKWIKILITSRSELQVKKKLEHFNPLEILPQDLNQQKDLKCFVKGTLDHFEVNSIDHLVSLCQGSFLYAYHMVNEQKEMVEGIEPNFRDYAPKGISGFYEKQFKRLKTGLQPHDSDILNAFVNVVAASSGTPLPIKIFLKCMNLSDEKYKIRNTIINVLSEILPVYDNCLTVYHKSLTDWLTLEGYEDHEFAADVADGTTRLWEVCKGLYRDVVSVKSVLDLELSPERKFALENGGKCLVDVGDTVDFHWLVNVRLNALKCCFCGDLNVDYYRILNIYKSAPCDDLYWSIIQHLCISDLMRSHLVFYRPSYKRESYLMYLQFLANAHFDFAKKNLSSQNTARDILVKENVMWVEDVVNVKNSNYEVISNTVLPENNSVLISVCSPDKKLVVIPQNHTVKVFQLPSLTMIFQLEVSRDKLHPIFSPDSSYFLYGSVRSCVGIVEQKEVAFIPSGAEYFLHCSFSSCGKKLVTQEEYFLKLWDVEKKELLVQVESDSYTCYFSSCSKYIVGCQPHTSGLVVRDSTTLKKFLAIDESCSKKCPDSYQIMYLVDRCRRFTRHYHFSTDKVIVSAPVESFTWKNRKCQILSCTSTLIIYDFINREVIDRFQIDCLPSISEFRFISKLDGRNFLLSLNNRQLFIFSLETPEESSVVSYVFPRGWLCATLSPDHLYLACYYVSYNALTIRSVDNGETLQTVELEKSPIAGWWSELYLWVVCEGVLVRFPYSSTNSKVLESGVEICPLTFGRFWHFREGVFVFTGNDNMITILKICDNETFHLQKIGDSLFDSAEMSEDVRKSAFDTVEFGKDGCAVLLHKISRYRTTCFPYKLWEFTLESGWELHFDGTIGTKYQGDFLSLTGTQNCRRLTLVRLDAVEIDVGSVNSTVSVFDFSSRKLYEYSLHLPDDDFDWVIDVAPNILLVKHNHRSHLLSVLNVSDNKTMTSLGFCGYSYQNWNAVFYLPSKGLVLAVVEDVIKYFKIHNLEKCLQT